MKEKVLTIPENTVASPGLVSHSVVGVALLIADKLSREARRLLVGHYWRSDH